MLAIMPFATQAQLKPEAGDKGFMFRFNGLSSLGLGPSQMAPVSPYFDPSAFDYGPGFIGPNLNVANHMLFMRYYLTDVSVLRAGLTGTFMNNQRTRSEVRNGMLDEAFTSTSFMMVGIGGGWERHYESASRRIDPYGGFQVNLSYLSNATVEKSQSITGTAYSRTTTVDLVLPGGITTSLDLFGGMNFFITDNLSIGTEFGLSLRYDMTEGEWTLNEVTTEQIGAAQPVTTGANHTGTSSQKGLSTSVWPATGFLVSYFF